MRLSWGWEREFAYRNNRLLKGKGTHEVIHRIREQITGKMRPPKPTDVEVPERCR